MSDFTVLPARVQAPLESAAFHQWSSGELVFVTFHRTRAGYLLRFPELADFEIELETRGVTCAPLPNVPLATCEHLYLNQVLPLLIARFGELVLHGSAAVINGRAVIFVGQAGRGKSTLAAAFSVDGHPFLTDDALVLRPSGRDYMVMPGHPSIRLWEDSHTALLPPMSPLAPAVHYTSKSRFLAGETLGHTDRPAALRCIYLLGDRSPGDVQIEPVGPGQAVAALLEHAFILDIHDRQLLASQFDRIAKVVDAVDCYRLDYPRCYGRLREVIGSIQNHAVREG